METETKKLMPDSKSAQKNLSDRTLTSHPQISSPPSNQPPTPPKRAVHLGKMDPELSTYDQGDVNEIHSVQTRHCLLRSHDAMSSLPLHTQSPPRCCHTTLKPACTTPAFLHACTHACKHNCPHARQHACLQTCTHAFTHACTPTQATHRNEMRCGLCGSVTVAAAVNIGLDGYSTDAGGKAGIRARTSLAHAPATRARASLVHAPATCATHEQHD